MLSELDFEVGFLDAVIPNICTGERLIFKRFSYTELGYY